MNTGRLEAFSDAVIAILVTIMVLELKVPHGTSINALRPLLPTGLTYVLSFTYLGIYWNNHHHMLQLTDKVNGNVLWANLHLLFWLSLFPVATGWMGQNGFAKVPTACYGVVLLLAAVAYYVLQQVIISTQGPGSRLQAAIGQRPEGEDLACRLRSSDPAGVRKPLGSDRSLRRRRAHVVRTGPAT